MTTNQFGFTHAIGPNDEGMYNSWERTTCETCGGPCQAPNSVWVDALLPGVTLVEGEIDPEQFYNDATDACECDACPLASLAELDI